MFALAFGGYPFGLAAKRKGKLHFGKSQFEIRDIQKAKCEFRNCDISFVKSHFLIGVAQIHIRRIPKLIALIVHLAFTKVIIQLVGRLVFIFRLRSQLRTDRRVVFFFAYVCVRMYAA